ncbi:hypothetical protein [Pedobacter metabolipauper]|uniref:Uncharacterized protein n=1 Tax=Pedobacter metabolipauper TaxID=425513 RepID=A0A4R6SQ59_9SPHI|nr:hypothetical protein [Pedobacter metabolipauper]TDQ06237.1 hypothetical protein ATK78_4618 [Pedobacter metabolipauper]
MAIILKSLLINFALVAISCSGCTSSDEPKRNDHKKVELITQQKNTPGHLNNRKKNTDSLENKKLRYLYFANGGIIGYYNDGTVVGCPRCDFNASNVAAMMHKKPHAKYTVEPGGILLINGTDQEVPMSEADGWAMVDYKWHINPPKN